MLLAIDIGNTNINIALIGKKGKVIRKFSTPTERPKLKTIVTLRSRVDKIIVVSVVPKALKKLKPYLKRAFQSIPIYTVGKDIKVPLRSEYNKKEIGQDRLITGFAARSLYGAPILIVDFGTAVTFDLVDKKDVYRGGLILPGIKMSLKSLSERTSMLPEVHLKKTNSFIGKDTKSSIRNGMIYGYSSICEGLIVLFRKKIHKNLKVIATGGDAILISSYAPSIKKIDLDLPFKGLYMLSKKI